MNRQDADILCAIAGKETAKQRELSQITGYSLGAVNKSLKTLIELGYVDDKKITEKATTLLEQACPRQAIILAAGFGMRMVPINLETPKALLDVKGEILIERLIRQLHEVGVSDIHVVVGFMKEQFDYLIDKYGVELVVNPEYAAKNNLTSLAKVKTDLNNTYIIPSDVWFSENPFSRCELYSWYMVSDRIDHAEGVRVNRKQQLIRTENEQLSNAMIGVSYLCGEEAKKVSSRVLSMSADSSFDNEFWEESLFDGKQMIVNAKIISQLKCTEINTYEQLRALDNDSDHLQSDALDAVASAMHCDTSEIKNIEVLKKGMTNRSFLFNCREQKYIMRIPGEGTEQLIDRAAEAAVYRSISGKGLCDDPVYIDPSNGYKITGFLDGIRSCDSEKEDDLQRCMGLLRQFHSLNLQVNHKFDIFGQIEFYEGLWNGQKSMYRDYDTTKAHVMELKQYIDNQPKQLCLTHIDAVPDNFLFYVDNGEEQLQLTDWEYAGMQDPHVDIAMFCIYALYSRTQVDHLINLYFNDKCTDEIRTKIYCYIASCGLLWSNWCEYKSQLGVEFGEYSLRQYRYAKDYYKIAKEGMN